MKKKHPFFYNLHVKICCAPCFLVRKILEKSRRRVGNEEDVGDNNLLKENEEKEIELENDAIGDKLYCKYCQAWVFVLLFCSFFFKLKPIFLFFDK